MNFRVEYVRPRSGRCFIGREAGERATKFVRRVLNKQDEGLFRKSNYAKDSGHFGRNSNGKARFAFLLTGILGITSGGGPLISVGIFRPRFAVLFFLTKRFFALIREFRKGIYNK